MNAPAPTPNAFARRRAGSRLAAVQALYQLEVGGRGATAVVREFLDDRLPDENRADDVDAAFFTALVEGAVAEQKDIDAEVTRSLADGWKLTRIDATVRAILRLGAFEILKRADVPARVAIDEYVEVAHQFFDGPEPGFVNAALDGLARRVRTGELGGDG